MNRTHNVRIDGIGRSGSSDAEIRNLYLSLFGNNNVLRFDVSMNNILFVSSLNTAAHLNGNGNHLVIGKLTFL